MTLAIDREAFSTIINGGMRHVGATMMPPPNGVWGMPDEMLKTLPGYDPDVAKNRAEARKIMETLGYGPDSRSPPRFRHATSRHGVSRPCCSILS